MYSKIAKQYNEYNIIILGVIGNKKYLTQLS